VIRKVFGCNGGYPDFAIQSVINVGGIDSDASYPPTAKTGQCRFNPNAVVAKFRGVKNIPKNESAIQTALTTTSPFAIVVSTQSWEFYKSGVMRAAKCGNLIDHAVQMVGYNATANPPYWILRNSWNTDWGVKGYIYVEMWKNACSVTDNLYAAVL